MRHPQVALLRPLHPAPAPVALEHQASPCGVAAQEHLVARSSGTPPRRLPVCFKDSGLSNTFRVSLRAATAGRHVPETRREPNQLPDLPLRHRLYGFEA